jgi:hypothetical protein
MAACLKTYRPDLLVLPLDTHPTGLLLVAGLDPANRQLRDLYNPIVRQLAWGPPMEVPPEVLTRQGVLSPHDSRVEELVRQLRAWRDQGLNHAQVREGLQAWRASRGL